MRREPLTRAPRGPARKEPAGGRDEEAIGRVLLHGAGVGPITPEVLDERAMEIAITEGRSPGSVTREDRARAAAELHESDLALQGDEERVSRTASSNTMEPAVDTGEEVRARSDWDEQMLQEEEILEGVREAEHEQMISAQRGTSHRWDHEHGKGLRKGSEKPKK